MKNKNIFGKFLLLTATTTSLLGLASCVSTTPDPKPEDKPAQPEKPAFTPFEVTDTLGRTVKIEKKVEKVLCIGASALRLYSYVGNMDLLCGVEKYEVSPMRKMPVRPYSYAYDSKFKALPALDTGGPAGKPNAEAILSVNPDVIFSLYNDADQMNKLSSSIKKPIVCLSYGKSDPFSDDVHKSLNLIGKVINDEVRSTAVSNYIKEIKADLNSRTKDIANDKKPSVYLGYNTFMGNKGGTLGDSLVNFTCFKETNANNVLAGGNYGSNNPKLEYEKVISLNPSMMFIDSANYGKFVADYKDPAQKAKLMQIDAVKNNNVHIIMPFNQYYTNIDIAMVDSYYVGKTMFPEQFKDVDITKKYNEILSKLLRVEKDYYDLTVKDTHIGYGAVDFSTIK